MKVHIPTPNGSYIEIILDVVDSDIPMLIELDVLEDDGLVVNNLTDKLEFSYGNLALRINGTHGSLYLTWNFSECFPRKQS